MNISSSIIVPVYNCASTLALQLDALAKQEDCDPFELIISDNGSTDETVKVARSMSHRFPNGFSIVDAGDMRGAQHARNVGVISAHTDEILLCDGDDVVDRHWASNLQRAVREHGYVGGSLFHNLPSDLWNEDQSDSIQRWAGNNLHPEDTGTIFQNSIITANMAFHRDLFKEIQGFEICYLGGAEDTEFSLRASIAGWQGQVEPSARLYYRLRTTAYRTFRQRMRWARFDVLVWRNNPDHGLEHWEVSPREAWKQLLIAIRSVPVRSISKESLTTWAATIGRPVGYLHGFVLYDLFRQRPARIDPAVAAWLKAMK